LVHPIPRCSAGGFFLLLIKSNHFANDKYSGAAIPEQVAAADMVRTGGDSSTRIG
jgi:hypothetical protein